ncbi:hypothetical protein [Planotetraspora phitsanulokensis]|uniref:Uncharacterized protein n=1 Tax=Planotetraspora phitsanulokensis TaxID=575192 RepID=A0A8J3UCG0_9ACTN|nr:hypothetical protein [Planotetraspora phitsanulokensis]GII42924.1 hypothetical protein Pph01_79270 [Planotetraspora phitsanulokensis]
MVHIVIDTTTTDRPPMDVLVTPLGGIMLLPAVWPPQLDADEADALAVKLAAAAAEQRGRAHR